jgi:hypothetical protein
MLLSVRYDSACHWHAQFVQWPQPERAHSFYSAQQQVTLEIGALDQRGKSLLGIGNALNAMGRRDEAQSHWQTAYAMLSEIGSPRADEAREIMEANTG